MKKISMILCSLGLVLGLTACGTTVPDLTAEETDLITEYAVQVLLKYDKNNSSRLVDLSQYDTVEPAATEEPEEEISEEEPEETAEEETDIIDATPEEEAEVIEVTAPSSIEEYYGIDGVSFRYTGYEYLQEYPDSSAEGTDIYFAMQATDGMELLVLHFQAVNESGSERTLSMMDYGTNLRVQINGDTTKSALMTMLSDDIETYMGTVPANGTADLVAVFEVEQGTQMNSMDLIMTGGDANATISLE